MILAAVNPLKCGSRSGPAVHCVVTTDDNGTIWFWLLRVYSRVRSSGFWRNRASDWMITHHTWLNRLYWLAVSEPNCAWIALYTSWIWRPSRVVLSRSTTARSCWLAAVYVVARPVSTWSSRAFFMKLFTTP